MTNHIGLAIACLWMALSLGPASARERIEQPGPHRAATTSNATACDDLLCLPIGTSASSARRTLEKHRFTLRHHEGGDSWHGLVGKQTGTNVPRKWRRSVTGAWFDGPGGEMIELSFVQMPGGAALSRLHLQMPDALAFDSLRSALDLSYGSGSCGDDRCAKGRVMSGNSKRDLQATLATDPHQRTVVLDATQQLEQLQAHLISDAVRDCRLSRRGVPVWSGNIVLAC